LKVKILKIRKSYNPFGLHEWRAICEINGKKHKIGLHDYHLKSKEALKLRIELYIEDKKLKEALKKEGTSKYEELEFEI